MQTTDATYAALLAADAPREVRAVIAGTTYGQDKIVSAHTVAAALKGSQLIGNCISSQLEMTLRDPGSIPRMARIDLGVRLNDGTTQSGWLPKGTFYIDTRTQEDDVLKITAYDAMLKTEQSFTQAGDQGEWPRTDISVVNEIAQRIGVGVDARTTALMSRRYLVQYPGIVLEDGTPQYSVDGGLTMREVLGYIGVMYGGNWVISDTGALRLVPMGTPRPNTDNAVCFSSSQSFMLSIAGAIKHWDGVIEYTDGVTPWTVWDGTTTLESGSVNRLYLRGTGNTVITGLSASDSSGALRLNGSDISISGNIETLLDYATIVEGSHPTIARGAFRVLFAYPSATEPGSGSIVNAAGLIIPPTAMAENCYQFAFQWCVGLTTAPTLPATTLAPNCYDRMFANCTSLVAAPALPATTLASYCYSSMFANCTSLVAAPALPATTLASECYSSMFYGCRSLVVAPTLPATTLASYCYNGMFYGCISLKISSTNIGEYQYVYRIPASGTGTPALDALTFMFSDTGGTFTDTPSINTTYYTTAPPVS